MTFFPNTPPVSHVANADITATQVVRATTSGHVIPATTSLRTLPFDGLALSTVASGNSVSVHVVGPVDPNILTLGDGYACAVGTNASGIPVRATDSTCVSAPNWIGTCDNHGIVTVNPIRKDFFDVRDFGAIPDFDYFHPDSGTDNLAAFNACMAASRVLRTNPLIAQAAVIIAPGQYYLSDTWHFTHTAHFRGAGNNSDETALSGTLLAFPKNCHGIQIHSSDENFGPFDASAPRSSIEHCVIYNKDLPTTTVFSGLIADPTWLGCGIYSANTCLINDVLVQGFGCKDPTGRSTMNLGGITLIGDAGARMPPPSGPLEFGGNVDDAVVNYAFVARCGGHGLFIAGNDANIVKVYGLQMTLNFGWGIYDVGGGSHFDACTGQGNRGQFSVIGCSVSIGNAVMHAPNPENGPGSRLDIQSPWIIGQTIHIPGLNASGIRKIVAIDMNSDPALITLDSVADVTLSPVTVSGGADFDGKAHDYKAGDPLHTAFTVSGFINCYSEDGLNDVNDPSLAIGGLLTEGPHYNPNTMLMNGGNLPNAGWTMTRTRGPRVVQFTYGENSTNMRAMSVQDVASGNYWSFEYDDTHGIWGWHLNGTGIHSLAFPTLLTDTGGRPTRTVSLQAGMYLGSPGGPTIPQCILVQALPSAPTSDTYKQGDVVYNTAPNVGGFVGWVCTVGGTPGTWNTFGSIVADLSMLTKDCSAGGTITFNAGEIAHERYKLTGSPSASFIVIIGTSPLDSWNRVVYNASTKSATIKASGGDTGVIVLAGQALYLLNDGTNMITVGP